MSEFDVYQALLIQLFIAALITVVALVFISAPYGRHTREGWGPTLHPLAVWFIMESPACLVFAAIYMMGERRFEIVPLFFFVMWQAHYVHRTFIYPLRMRMSHKPIPIVIMLIAVVFNSVNGYLNGRFLTHFGPSYDITWFSDPRFIAGFALFVTGYAINRHSDWVLKNLRKPGESGYKIPQGGFFQWVSSPNYFGELIEWGGFALAAWSPAGLAFFVYTAANLVPRAFTNHKWYLEKFADYPPERKAIIPYVV